MEDLNDKVNNGGASAAGKLASTEWNQSASEIQNAITAAGITLSSGDLTQLLVAVSKFAAGMSQWCTDSGSATAYVLTPAYTVGMPLFTGLTLTFRPANNNSGASPTVNYNGTGVKNIKNESGGSVVAGDLDTSRDAQIRYDGTNFRLLTNSTNLILNNLYKKGYIRGFYMLPDGSDYDFEVGVGETVDHSGVLNLVLGSAITKNINNAWSAGNNGGARGQVAALANNTWYRVYLIGGTSATTDWGIDTSFTAAALLGAASTATGNTYDKYRQIGWVRTNGSAKLTQFYMDPVDFTRVYWQSPVSAIDSSNPGITRQLVTVLAPTTDAMAILNVWVGDNSGTTPAYYLDVRTPEMNDVAADSSNHVIRMTDIGGGSASNNIIIEVVPDGSSRVAYRFGGSGMGSSVKFSITTRGFRYMRGTQ